MTEPQFISDESDSSVGSDIPLIREIDANGEERQLRNQSKNSMTHCFKQLWLLLLKNSIVAKRAIAWTIFEIVLPLILLLPITILITKSAGKNTFPDMSYPSLPVSGDASDLFRRAGRFMGSIHMRNYCSKDIVKLGYCGDFPELDEYMKLFASRYKGERGVIEVERFHNKVEMLTILKNDSVLDPSHGMSNCPVNKYIGGVFFKTFDFLKHKLDYQILMSTRMAAPEDWKLTTQWDNPYGVSTDTQDIPRIPPYWNSGFLSIQHALDSMFIQYYNSTLNRTITDEETPFELELQRIPEPSYSTNTLTIFIDMLPFLWGLCLFCNVLHSSREVAQEKQTVKAFLSVMGLRTSMFYLSHILFSWMKAAIIILVCAVPFALVMKEVNPVLFIITCLLYGLGAISFAVLCSAPFKTPNSALKITIVLWAVSVGAIFKMPSLDDRLSCFLMSFNINHAFRLAMTCVAEYLQRDEYLGFTNMFKNGTMRFTLGFSLLMIILDIFLMIGLTLLIDKCLDNGDWSLRSLFQKESTSHDVVDGTDPEGAHEVDTGLQRTEPDIEAEGLVKVWSQTGERAVDGLNLKAYKGEVTVLLGHNGAGKSTTFSMITGLVKPTAGKVLLCQQDASKGCYHENVGYCPQGNALFDRLTVDEHLWLIHGLKGVGGDYSLEAEQLLSELQLLPKQHELSKNLSGGMKRKLCVCLALIGGSRVVLLDEPTAGMDPGARQDVEHLMEKTKGDKTYLLTTHYMDEAERLGDRVFIMAKGRVVCSGSSTYLKGRVGSGYVLTIVVRENVDTMKLAPEILPMIQNHVKKATAGEVHGMQLEVNLPKEEQNSFAGLFEELEQKQNQLKITGFGLSLNSLEQVFLKVGEEIDKKNGIITRMESTARDQLIESQMSERYYGFCLVWSQLLAIFRKRIMYSVRNWPQLITQILVPLVILILVAWFSKTSISFEYTDDSHNLWYQAFGPSRVIYQSSSANNEISKTYLSVVKSVSDFNVVELDAKDNATSTIAKLPKDFPATGFGALFNGLGAKILFNNRALHSIPTSLNAVNNARLKSIDSTGSIQASIIVYYPYKDVMETESLSSVKNSIIEMVVGPLMVVLLALVTSTTVMFLVNERSSKFVHQQALTGVSPVVFWIGSFLYDLLLFLIACTLFLIVFIVSQWQKDFLVYVAMLWFLYFMACTPFIYIVSLIFTSPSKANVLLVIFQIIVTLVAIATLYLIRMSLAPLFGDISNVTDFIETLLLIFLPSYSLSNGILAINEFQRPGKKTSGIMHWNYLGRPVTCMSVFAVVASIMFVAFQFKFVQRTFYKIWDYRYRKVADSDAIVDEDDDVRKERLAVEESAERTDCSMVVKGLTKLFGDIRALDHLTLAVKRRECFGLLGVNGAGKTTTFDILTGRTFPTFGSATLDGRDVVEQIAIGYCPQFDAMMLDLTGREVLEILARLHGFINFKEKGDIVLRAIGMEEHGDKQVRFYSGGQRRKVSVGIALLAVTKMIILDEPTAGIDPKARRDIWSVLTAVRDKSESAQLLTSHSMDECEALCSRIAVLNKGRMIAIGTSQGLKSKFGNNFTLTMVASSVETRERTIQRIGEEFPTSRLKTHIGSASLTLKWQIARSKDTTGSPTDTWSAMFNQCYKLAKELDAKDFCLSQSSLEETFLTLANRNVGGVSRTPSTASSFQTQ